MNKILRILYFIQKYYAIAGYLAYASIGLYLAIIIRPQLLVWFDWDSAADILLEMERGTYPESLQLQYASYSLLLIIPFAMTLRYHAKVFGNFHKFLQLNTSAIVQRQAVIKSQIKNLLIIYALSLVSMVRYLLPRPPQDAAFSYDFLPDLYQLVVPEFGGSLALLVAGILYVFLKHLDTLEQLESTVTELKHEAELVI